MEVAVGGSLLGSISEFCRRTGMAESTFGRRAVNDGKFVARLRDGARVTPETLQRVNQFMVKHGAAGAGESPPELLPLISGTGGARPIQPAAAARDAPPEKNVRVFGNRPKDLVFVKRGRAELTWRCAPAVGPLSSCYWTWDGEWTYERELHMGHLTADVPALYPVIMPAEWTLDEANPVAAPGGDGLVHALFENRYARIRCY